MGAEVASLDTVGSVWSMRLNAGLCNISSDVVSPGPASRLQDVLMVGMALTRDIGEPVGAHRVLLLVRGTQETDVDCVDEKLPMVQQV